MENKEHKAFEKMPFLVCELGTSCTRQVIRCLQRNESFPMTEVYLSEDLH